jgi:putative AbiEi antitoxin of type IV toxin-antitoxin system
VVCHLAGVRHISSADRQKRAEPPAGPRVADLSRRQGGAVSRAQLAALGITDGRIGRLREHGWLTRVHRGVYRVGTLTPDGVLWAASLAMGEGAVLTHRTAGHELAALRGRPPRVVDVTVPVRRRARSGIRPHCARLHPRDVTTRRGLRFTTVSRTLLDLAATLREPQLQAAVDEARVQRRLHRPSIEATISRSPGHHGIGALRRAIARHDRGRGVPIGDFERRAIGFLRDHDLPPYVRNYTVKVAGEPFCIDVAWTGHRVGIEFDSRTFHDNDPDFVTDRRRSRRLAAAGWHIVRATWIDLDERPDELAADVWALLRARLVA